MEAKEKRPVQVRVFFLWCGLTPSVVTCQVLQGTTDGASYLKF